jgi:hypothetical protein
MCGLTASDETWCWGSVAEVAGTRFTTPQRLSEDPRFKVISVNGYNGCGIDANRQGWCWGSGATVGNGSVVGQLTAPVPIVGNLRLSAITVGDHVCALTVSGDAYCWGQNLWPMAGGWAATPTLVEGGFKFVAITGGWFYNCALTAAGEAHCWGQNISGQLGTTPPGSTAVPRPVTGGLRFSMISAGLGMTCGVTLDHNGYCWGADQPDNSTSSAPKPVPGGLSFTRIDVSTPSVFGSQWYGHACGTTLDGTIYCWGANSRGQLGNGQVDTSAVTTPTRVLGLKARTLAVGLVRNAESASCDADPAASCALLLRYVVRQPSPQNGACRPDNRLAPTFGPGHACARVSDHVAVVIDRDDSRALAGSRSQINQRAIVPHYRVLRATRRSARSGDDPVLVDGNCKTRTAEGRQLLARAIAPHVGIQPDVSDDITCVVDGDGLASAQIMDDAIRPHDGV